MPVLRWLGIMAVASVIAFGISRTSFRGREFATMYVCAMAVAVGMAIPLMASLTRRDVAPFELLFPRSRTRFLRLRTLSVASKFSYLFAALLLYMVFVQYVCFGIFSYGNIVRVAIIFVATTIAGTGLVLWLASIRNIFALGLLVVVGLVVVILAAFSCLDFRWIDSGKRGQEIHEIVSSPVFYAISYALAGILLWTGYHRMLKCELARQ